MRAIAEMTTTPKTADPSVEGANREGFEAPAPTAIVASRDAETRRWTKKWLESAGFRVAAATSLDEAAGLLRTGTAEVVVVDGALRSADGLGACPAIRRLPGGGELPVLTVCSGDREAARAILEGSTDVVRKPIQWPLLSQRAARLVHAYRTFKEKGWSARSCRASSFRQECRRRSSARCWVGNKVLGLPRAMRTPEARSERVIEV